MTTPNGIRTESAWIPVASIEVPTRHANPREISDVSQHASLQSVDRAAASMHARKRETP